MRITLEWGPFFTFVLRSDRGDTRLIQSDTDFPGIATTFGWDRPQDETVESIWDAYEYLEVHVGVTVEDPGYF